MYPIKDSFSEYRSSPCECNRFANRKGSGNYSDDIGRVRKRYRLTQRACSFTVMTEKLLTFDFMEVSAAKDVEDFLDDLMIRNAKA